MSVRLVFSGLAVVAFAAGCASSGGSKGTSAGGASSRPAGGSNTVAITVKSDRLTAPDGKTLYYNTVDTAKAIKCTGVCAKEWPPLTGSPKVGSGLDGGDFATAARPDGSMQVTFYGHPLYEFAGDAPGQAGGKGMADEGGHWVVATPQQAGGGSSAPSMSGSSAGTGGY